MLLVVLVVWGAIDETRSLEYRCSGIRADGKSKNSKLTINPYNWFENIASSGDGKAILSSMHEHAIFTMEYQRVKDIYKIHGVLDGELSSGGNLYLKPNDRDFYEAKCKLMD